MIGALLYLMICTARNRIRVRIQRLRSPRYAIGLVVGIAYLYLMVWRRTHRPVSADAMHMMSSALAAIAVVGSVVLFLTVMVAWLWPTSRAALNFTRADVQFLFTAPITRRQLVAWTILKSQLTTLVGSAFFTLVFRRPGAIAGGSFFVGVALMMGILNVHFTGIALTRESLRKPGATGWWRQWLPVTVMVAALAALILAMLREWPVFASMATARDMLTAIERFGTQGIAGVVLWPFHAMVALVFAGSAPALGRALVPVLAIAGLNVAWVMSADAAFEEAVAERAEKVARRRSQRGLAAPRAAAAPFRLSLSGRPETAIVWKNLVLLGRYASLKNLLRLLPLVFVISFAITRSGSHAGLMHVLAPACMMLAGFTALMGPQMMRNDLRQDLAQLGVLKTWPVRGATLVRGEVLAPAVVLTVIAWLFVLAALALPAPEFFGPAYAATGVRFSYGIAVWFLLPGIILIQLLLQNGIAVMFPAWIVIGPARARGVDVMGQRLFMLAGLLLVLVVAILPAAIAGGIVAWGERMALHRILVIPPAMVAAAVLLAEAFVGTEALGRILDRTDITAVDAPE